jgi:hypothetical protein
MGIDWLAKALRIGLAWITTDKGTVWHNGMTVGYRAFSVSRPTGSGAAPSSATRPRMPPTSTCRRREPGTLSLPVRANRELDFCT